jgi:hypothetical protein
LRFASFILACLSLSFFLSGAGPASDALDVLRQGNAAFERDEYELSLSLYRRAEGKIADPGWLAFNEGAALYKLGRYREAEIHYWLSRQDAVGPRLARILYDLGNAVFRQAGSKDAALFQRAIGFYEECLSQAKADPELLENARHNLALARELLKKSKAGNQNPPEPSNPGNKQPRDSIPEMQPNHVGSNSGLEDDSGSGRQTTEGSDREEEGNSKKASRQPGIGNLPPVPDSDELVPLNSKDTSAYLKKAAERILKERRGHYGKSGSRPSQNIKDW